MSKLQNDQVIEQCRHIICEVGIENICPSLMQVQALHEFHQAHNAIHEFNDLAILLYGSPSTNDDFHRKTAYFLYHSMTFDYAHRSLIESLCAYYNPALALLRSTLESILMGAFWECLSHKRYRESSRVPKDRAIRQVFEQLKTKLEQNPNMESRLENVSAGIFDVTESFDFRPSIKAILKQLNQWEIVVPIPAPTESIYAMYDRLSANIHAKPKHTDIARRISVVPSHRIFDQTILRDVFTDYVRCLHRIMDVATVAELNVMKDHIEKYNEVKACLKERLGIIERLNLEWSLKRAQEIVN